jgi:hypothetical protein
MVILMDDAGITERKSLHRGFALGRSFTRLSVTKGPGRVDRLRNKAPEAFHPYLQ